VAAAHGEKVVNTGGVCRSTCYTWGKGYNSLPELSPGIVAAHEQKVVTAYLSMYSSCRLE
jgi:hypothetical protein